MATAESLLAAQALVSEYFARVDQRDIPGAVALYAEDATFLGARGPAEIRETMLRGLQNNVQHRSKHVIANLRSSSADADLVLVEYTALAYTLDGPGPFAARSILDQQMLLRPGAEGGLRIVEHRIFGFEAPAASAS